MVAAVGAAGERVGETMSAEQPFQYQKYADVTRETEKLAFELVLHILRSGLVWAIWLERVAE